MPDALEKKEESTLESPSNKKPQTNEGSGEASVKGAPESKMAKLMNGPWVPLLIIICMAPVLSFLMTEYILIPRMKKAWLSWNNSAQGDEVASSGKAKVEKKNEPAKGEKEVEALKSVAFNDIMANLAGSLQSRYVKISFTVEGSDPNFVSLVEASRIKLVDATLTVLSALSLNSLEDPGVKNTVRNDLLNLFETVLGRRMVQYIYFSEFVVQ